METIPEVKIEGLEEVIASLTALSQAIDHLGQSAKETLQPSPLPLSLARLWLVPATAAGST